MDAASPRLARLPMAALLNAVDTVEASEFIMPASPKRQTHESALSASLHAAAQSETPAPDQAAPPPTVDPVALQGAGDNNSKAEKSAAEATPMEVNEAQGKPAKPSSSQARATRKAQPKDQQQVQPVEPPAPAPTKRASRRTRQPSTKMQSPSPPPPKRSKTVPASRTPSVDRSSTASLQSVTAVDAAPAAKPARAARKRRPPADTPVPTPPLPPTPAAAAPAASKATRAKASAPASLKRSHSTVAQADNTLTPSLRICELCKQVNNICASFYCSCCRRVYHAQCFAQSLAPYYDKTQRIELQMDALRLNAPKHQVSMLRCNSCRAAFIEFTRGGYQWDCDCITCKQPEKLLGYRSFTLLEMMRDMAEERKQKKKGGGGGAKAAAAANAMTATADSKKKANPRPTRQSRRVAAQETVEPDADGVVAAAASIDDQAAVDLAGDQETKPSIVIEMSVDDGNEDGVVEVDEHGVEAAVSHLHQVETVDDSDQEDVVHAVEREPVTSEEPEREHEGTPPAAVSRKSPSSPASKPRKMPKGRGLEAVVSGNCPRVNIKAKKKARADEGNRQEEMAAHTEAKALYADVNMTVEDSSRTFRITCTEDPDFRTGGILKEAVFTWHYKIKPEIRCECCQGVFAQTLQFVNHTSDAFLKEPTTKSASDFLFVQHQHSGNLSPLSPFLTFLRENVHTKSTLQNKPTKNAKRSSKKAADSPVQDELLSKAFESERLNNAEIFRVKRAGAKASDETFGIRVVCMDREGTHKWKGRYSIEHPSADTVLTRARKAGCLLFSATGKEKYKGVFCDCCNQLLPVEDFVLHTLENDWDRKFKDKYLFVENSDDSLVFNELADLWAPLEQLKLKNLLAVYLKKRVKDTIEK